MIERREHSFRTTHAKTARAQFRERLRRRHFMHQVQIDIENRRRRRGLLAHEVRIPDLVEEGFPGHYTSSDFDCARASSAAVPDPGMEPVHGVAPV
jgi:hypothetical protein